MSEAAVFVSVSSAEERSLGRGRGDGAHTRQRELQAVGGGEDGRFGLRV